MYHSITIGDKNTWDDWHLVPTSRPLVNPPTPKTNYIDIPGGNGSFDVSELVTGEIVYQDRTGSWEFIVMNGYADWATLYSEIMDYLHGQKFKARLEDDPSYYYEGRFSVNQWDSDEHYSKITIDYQVFPYKMEDTSSLEDWLWDPFNFEDGIIRDYREINIMDEYTMNIICRRMPVVPVFILQNGSVSITYNEMTFDLSEGTNRITNILLKEGDNTLTFTGNGVISIDYTGGKL